MSTKILQNKKKLLSFWKIIKRIFFWALIIHGIMLLVPLLIPNTFLFVKTIIKLLSKLLIGFYALILAIAVPIVGVLLASKDNKSPLIEDAKKFLILGCILAIFVVPALVINAASSYLVDFVEENYYSPPDITKPEENEVITIDYHNTFFNDYDIAYLEENKFLISKAIVAKIKEPVKDFNKEKDKDGYTKNTRIAGDYEKLYKYILKENLFAKYEEERFSFPQKIISSRTEADGCYKTSENQRQIALRYKDWGDDLHSHKKLDGVDTKYKNAIFWSLTGLQTSYNEKHGSMKDRNKMLDIIISSYRELSVTEANKENAQRALIIMEIYEYVKVQIN